MELLNSSVGFGARQAIPLRDLEPESVGTWPAVSSTQLEDLECSNTQYKGRSYKILVSKLVDGADYECC